MLKTLISTYYNKFISESFTQKVVGLIYSNLFKKDPDTNFKLIFEIEKNSQRSELILATYLTDDHNIKLTVKKEFVEMKKERLELFLEPFVIKSRDLTINLKNRTNPKGDLYSAIEEFEVDALNSIVKSKIISESNKESLFITVYEQKKLLKALGYQSWVEPKLIFRTLIDTKDFDVSDNSYKSKDSKEFSDGSRLELMIKKMLLNDSYTDFSGLTKEAVLHLKESESKIFFWLLEGLISDDIAGLSTFVPSTFDKSDADLKQYNWIDYLVNDFLYLITSEKMSISELIESGMIGEHTPALLAITELLK